MAKKLTIVEQYAAIVEVAKDVLTKEQVAFLESRAEMVASKNATRKPTKTQVENEALKEAILGWLKDTGGEHTIGEIMKAVPELADLTNQRVSALVRQLKEAEIVDRFEVKGRAYFKAK